MIFISEYCFTAHYTRVANNIGATLDEYGEYWRILVANLSDIAPILAQYLQCQNAISAILRQHWFTNIAPISNNIYCANIEYS